MSQPMPGSRSIRSYTPREIFYHKNQKPVENSGRIDSTYAIDGANTGFTDEIREGTVMARLTTSKQWVPCKRSCANGSGVESTSFIVDKSAPFKAADEVSVVSKHDVLILADLDAAAATGVALYLHVDEKDQGHFGHIESVAAGNANYFVDVAGGAKLRINDDDAAATGGTQIYYDEDAALGSRLLSATTTGKDVYVPLTDGRCIKITYHASPSTPGVAVYGDDDGAAAAQRLLFVSPTNASGVEITDANVGTADLSDEVVLESGLTISSLVYSTNTITLSAATTWADGVCHLIGSGSNLAGSEIPRAVNKEVVALYDPKTRGLVDKYATYIVGNAQLSYDAVNQVSDLPAMLAAGVGQLDRLEFYDDGVRVDS